MPIVRYGEKLNVLVAAKGHPYPRDPFMAIFDEMEGISASLVEQPAVQSLMNPGGMKGFDALVLYDMPGLDFRSSNGPRFVEPSGEFKSGFRALLDSGIGIVALHHASVAEKKLSRVKAWFERSNGVTESSKTSNR